MLRRRCGMQILESVECKLKIHVVNVTIGIRTIVKVNNFT